MVRDLWLHGALDRTRIGVRPAKRASTCQRWRGLCSRTRDPRAVRRPASPASGLSVRSHLAGACRVVKSPPPVPPVPPLNTSTDLRYPGLPVPQRYHAMAVIILGIAVSVLDGTVVNLALPGIVRDLQSTASQAVWVVNAYQLATLALILPLATLGDRIGYRRVYLVGVAVFTVASALCSMADSLAVLAVARAVQGAGAAGMM